VVAKLIRDTEELCDETCQGTEELDKTSLNDRILEDQIAIDLSDIFKALGDPTRVKIIYALIQNELCVHDLSVVLNMAQSAISHQLRYLRNLRIVKRRKSGKTVYYSLDDDHVEQIFVLTLEHVKHK
jgi:DNA-binding transcriptional ArsR family regulator